VIVYRVQTGRGEDWANSWHLTRSDAIRHARKVLRDDKPSSMVVDRIELDTSKGGIVEALNHAQVNRVNWPGLEVWRS